MRRHQITTIRPLVEWDGNTRISKEGRFDVYYLDEDRTRVVCRTFKFGDGVVENDASKQAYGLKAKLDREAKAIAGI